MSRTLYIDLMGELSDDDLLDELRDRGITLDWFDDDELIDEIENRGISIHYSIEEMVENIFHLRRQGKDFDKELDAFLYHVTGRAI